MGSSTTQVERIIGHMERFGSITPIEAQRSYGVMRLAARISDIRRMGIQVSVRRVNTTNRYGERVTVCEYSLVKGEQE